MQKVVIRASEIYSTPSNIPPYAMESREEGREYVAERIFEQIMTNTSKFDENTIHPGNSHTPSSINTLPSLQAFNPRSQTETLLLPRDESTHSLECVLPDEC